MRLERHYLTKNECFTECGNGKRIGIVVHSTGCNNPNLRRYINYPDLLGPASSMHWDNRGIYKCVHAMIGKDKDGNIMTVQTLPWEKKCWGCASGKKGSFNITHIQFEILEDGLNDNEYFNKVYKEAVDLCVYLCKMYHLQVRNIVCHKEAYRLGYASDHMDVEHWFPRFNKSMDIFRKDVENGINSTDATKPIPEKNAVKEYVVKNGDSLWSIANNNNMNIETLCKINGIDCKHVIHPGDKLSLSQVKDSYIVKNNDSLWKIAKDNHISLDILCKLNSFDCKHVIHPGDKLNIK